MNEEIEISAPTEREAERQDRDIKWTTPDDYEMGAQRDEMDDSDFDYTQPGNPGYGDGTIDWASASTSSNRAYTTEFGTPIPNASYKGGKYNHGLNNKDAKGNYLQQNTIYETTLGELQKAFENNDPSKTMNIFKPTKDVSPQNMPDMVQIGNEKITARPDIVENKEVVMTNNGIQEKLFDLTKLDPSTKIRVSGNGLLIMHRLSLAVNAGVNLDYLKVTFNNDPSLLTARVNSYNRFDFSKYLGAVKFRYNTTRVLLHAMMLNEDDKVFSRSGIEETKDKVVITGQPSAREKSNIERSKAGQSLIGKSENEAVLYFMNQFRSVVSGFVPVGNGVEEMTSAELKKLFEDGTFENVDEQVVRDCIKWAMEYRNSAKRKGSWQKAVLPADLQKRLGDSLKKAAKNNFEKYVQQKTGKIDQVIMDAITQGMNSFIDKELTFFMNVEDDWVWKSEDQSDIKAPEVLAGKKAAVFAEGD